jgi:ubiquinol-cytochrome c reductase cytochrome c subunit
VTTLARNAVRVISVMAVALLGLLVAGGCSAYHPPPEPWPEVPASTQDRGRALFDQTCAGCHGPNAQGTPRAPSLADVGSAGVDFQLRTGRMPLSLGEKYRAAHQKAKLSQQDIDAVVDYLHRLHPGGPPIPDVKPGDIQLGRQLYAANCASCHAAAGTGGTLTGGHDVPDLMEATPVEVGEAIRYGPGYMPAFPEQVLDSRQVDAIASYVQTLQGRHGDLDQGGLSLGGLGPVTEGLVGWVIGVGILMFVARRLGSRAE